MLKKALLFKAVAAVAAGAFAGCDRPVGEGENEAEGEAEGEADVEGDGDVEFISPADPTFSGPRLGQLPLGYDLHPMIFDGDMTASVRAEALLLRARATGAGTNGQFLVTSDSFAIVDYGDVFSGSVDAQLVNPDEKKLYCYIAVVIDDAEVARFPVLAATTSTSFTYTVDDSLSGLELKLGFGITTFGDGGGLVTTESGLEVDNIVVRRAGAATTVSLPRM